MTYRLMLLALVPWSSACSYHELDRIAGNSFGSLCEDGVFSTAASPIRILDSPEPRRVVKLHLPEGLRIVGLAPQPETDRIYMFDGLAREVLVYSLKDSTTNSVAYLPPPSENELGASSLKDINHLALIRNGVLAIYDADRIYFVYVDGTLIGSHPADGAKAGPWGQSQLAAIAEDAVLFASTGAWRLETPDPSVRTKVDLIRLTIQHERAVIADTVGAIRNALTLLPSFERFPPPYPYRRYLNRSWNASSDGIVTTSWQHHGVCFFDVNGHPTGTYRVAAASVIVDEDERERVLSEFVSLAAYVPNSDSLSWRDFFAEHWPAEAPKYIDVIATPEGAAALRMTPKGGRAIDWFNRQSGYAGTTIGQHERLPLAYVRGCKVYTSQSGNGVHLDCPSSAGGSDGGAIAQRRSKSVFTCLPQAVVVSRQDMISNPGGVT